MRIRASMGCGWLKLERLANTLILQQGYIHVGGELVVQRNGINFLEDGGEISMVESDDGGIDIKYPTQWRPGIHTISALVVAWSPSISADVHDTMLGNEIAVHIMVADALSDEIPEEFRCDMLLSVDHLGISPVDSGSLYNAWHQQQRCLRIFTDMFPSCWQAQYMYGKIFDARGLWAEAAARYRFAADAGVEQVANASLLAGMAATMLGLDESERVRTAQTCRWVRRNVSDAPLTDDVEDLYLSVVMVGRHDGTEFCQSPPDACLDRLQASLSILLRQLVLHGMAADAEVILVEWNPCPPDSAAAGAAGPASRASCRPRPGGYISLEELVRSRVEVPSEVVAVRILTVPEGLHGALYNPLGLDLLEYVGKNVAARRARGRFVLFMNPDDCLSDPMAAFLARRRLRGDVFYNTYRGSAPTFARGRYSPPSRLPSAEAMARSVFRTGRAALTDHASQFRLAGCGAGEADDEPMRTDLYSFHDLQEDATGDFFLAPKRALHATRGYPEFPSNLFTDGTLVYAAVAHGYGQLVLAGPCTIYHQDHPRSFNAGPALLPEDYRRLAQALLDARDFANHRGGDWDVPAAARPLHQWNDALWGLAEERVPQVELVREC
jgi:hypothetical protein